MTKLRRSYLNKTWQCYAEHSSVENLPSIHDVVFVISSVDINMIGIKNKEREHNNNDLYRMCPSIYKISIEYVRIVERRSTILKQNVRKVRVNTNAKQSSTACKKQNHIYLVR